MKKLLASFALAIAAFGMVGGTASASPTHLTAKQVEARLARVGCVPETGGGGTLIVGVQVSLECWFPAGAKWGGQVLTISQYAQPSQVAARVFEQRQAIDCSVKSMGSPIFVLMVTTPTVIVDFDGYNAQGIKRAIGPSATVQAVHC